ncbi:hypothetical protein H4219_003101 [Mycoemilia scoparia]|uniref:3-oxo-5-alpha-steroid 4-dehydrogenase C-terminal domain-containing protein n=1 Tax=Mycoemilia scoparia TaxID=417184 RepID=A0A9W8DPR3_9FUNG|nr:hypothetical protein H4219_003101 [Mycoemilia scoparia]
MLRIIGAPYGSQGQYLKSLLVNGKLAWVLMEIISPVVYISTIASFLELPESPSTSLPLFSFSNILSIPKALIHEIYARAGSNGSLQLVLITMWLTHYLHRAIIYPLSQKSRAPMHVGIMLLGIGFNLLNGFVNGYWVGSSFQQTNTTTSNNASDLHFIIGVAVFTMGFIGNIYHDHILVSLRKNKDNKSDNSKQQQRYFIPHGGLFGLVSCPHYLCEVVEWVGYWVATGLSSRPAILFAISTFSVLCPRALEIHEWYKNTFKEYPKNRKAIVPFLI